MNSRREAILEAVRVALDEPALRAALLDISSVCSHMEECPEMYAVEQVEEVEEQVTPMSVLERFFETANNSFLFARRYTDLRILC